nr:DUF6665 family protein [Nitratireductor luteus]
MLGNPKNSRSRTGVDTLDYELVEEMAIALGEAGRRAERALGRLHAQAPDEVDPELLKVATDAVYAYFIQRELCGLKRHDAVIRDMGIPRKVLARLGSC